MFKCGRNKRTTKIRYYYVMFRTVISVCVQEAPTLSHVSDRPLCIKGTNVISRVRPATVYKRHQHYLTCPTGHCVQKAPTLSLVSDRPLYTKGTNTKTKLPLCQ